ncbi:MAG: transcriptional repressor NrdR [bacterium]|nr:transcriptional repressor NrdR [bacterium]
MRCPFCGFDNTQVKDSRSVEENAAIRRRRYCAECSARFTTVERIQMIHLSVKKKNGEIEPFDRDKLEKAVKLSLHKRPIDQEKIERVLNSIVRQLEVLGDTEVEAHVIGEMVMDVLKDLDPVAYIRFASIYKEFKLAEDFAEFAEHISEDINET